jgi:NAD(P)H dehydrogenase (quinone)
MRWYILVAHPLSGSFSHAVCEALTQGLTEAEAAFEVNDLYASRFDPVMGGEDLNQFSKEGPLLQDVLTEQAKVDAAECLALIYPVWWNDGPAILKGWMDRVLTKGWAYDIREEGEIVPRLRLKKVVILNTAGNPPSLNEAGGLNQAARLTKSLGTFGFCGVKSIDHRILDNVMADEEGRKGFLEEVRALGRSG